MASNSSQRLITDGYDISTLTSPAYTLTTAWADKRSAPSCSLSFVVNGGVPDGYLHVETSNAPENNSNSFGSGPYFLPGSKSPLDAVTYPGSTVHVLATGTTHYDVITAARWVRLVFVNNASSGTMPVYAWISTPFSSP
jgi:hypothetical protein